MAKTNIGKISFKGGVNRDHLGNRGLAQSRANKTNIQNKKLDIEMATIEAMMRK